MYLWEFCLRRFVFESYSAFDSCATFLLLNYTFKMLISRNRIIEKISLANLPHDIKTPRQFFSVLTSTLSGCCLITKGLWCPIWISGSSYVTAWPTGITLGSNGLLVGVLHGKKFWTFLLCLEGDKKREVKRLI